MSEQKFVVDIEYKIVLGVQTYDTDIHQAVAIALARAERTHGYGEYRVLSVNGEPYTQPEEEE